MTEAIEVNIHCPLMAHNAGVTVSRGRGTHPTRVIDSFELIFVREGLLSMFEDGDTFAVNAGQTLVLYPGHRHGGTQPFPPELVFYWIHFAVSADRLSADVVVELPKLVTVRRPDHLAELFRRFLDDQETKELTPLSSALLVGLMLTELRPQGDPGAGMGRGQRGKLIVSKAETFIRTHFESAVSASIVAEHVDCNQDYLNRMYKQEYGRTLTDGIHKVRLAHACKQLRESTLTLDQVAVKCGFDDVGYLRRLFKRNIGSTPSQYRARYSKIHVNTE